MSSTKGKKIQGQRWPSSPQTSCMPLVSCRYCASSKIWWYNRALWWQHMMTTEAASNSFLVERSYILTNDEFPVLPIRYVKNGMAYSFVFEYWVLTFFTFFLAFVFGLLLCSYACFFSIRMSIFFPSYRFLRVVDTHTHLCLKGQILLFSILFAI